MSSSVNHHFNERRLVGHFW